MTVLLEPNGSSKSKVFDVFAFPSRRFLVATDTGIAKLTKFFGVRSMGAANICTATLSLARK
jgi:hypothetical protein